jgi:probable HAF family extracellular repeat protein
VSVPNADVTFVPEGNGQFLAVIEESFLQQVTANAVKYFTRNIPSRSVNGEYTFFGLTNTPSPTCTGHLEIQPTLIEVPNATITVAEGINDHAQIVGFFVDQSNSGHGFIYERGQYTQIDYPGALATQLNGINNSGQMVGLYTDLAGLPHGFLYSQGSFFPVNIPGSLLTFTDGINSRGNFVGGYFDTSAIEHGFVFENGQIRTVDTPFGSQSEVVTINGVGNIAGVTYDDPSGPLSGFIVGKSGLSRFDFPGASITSPNAINDQNDHGGAFFDVFGGYGYVTVNGYLHSLYYYVLGMNNHNQIVGNAFNTITNRRIGFVATLPAGSGPVAN